MVLQAKQEILDELSATLTLSDYGRVARHLFTMRRGAGHISEMPPTQLVKQLQ